MYVRQFTVRNIQEPLGGAIYGLEQVIFYCTNARVNKFTEILLNLFKMILGILILRLSPTRRVHILQDVVLLITLSTVRHCIINLKSVARILITEKSIVFVFCLDLE